VFPKSWYPDTTPSNLEKWKIPACQSCNGAYSKLEEQLLLRFSLTLDHHDPRSSGIYQSIRRSIMPELAPNEKEATIRARVKERLYRDVQSAPGPSQVGYLPNFGPG